MTINAKTPTPPLTERIRTVEDYRESGLTLSQFSREVGMHVATLSYWNKEYLAKWRHFATSQGKQPTSQSNGRQVIDVAFERTPSPAEPDWKRLYEEEKSKVEALQKAILVLGYQL